MNRESCRQVNRWVIYICDLNGMRCVTHGQVSVWSHRCGYTLKADTRY